MVNQYCCCSLKTGVRIIAFVSVVFAVILVGTSAWVLKEIYEERESYAFKIISGAATAAADTLGKFFGPTDNIELEKRSKILLVCSGVGVAVGALQCLASFLLLIGAASKSRSGSIISSFVNRVGFFAIVGSLICMYTKSVINFEELDKLPEKMKYWVGAMIGDAVFLLYAICTSCICVGY